MTRGYDFEINLKDRVRVVSTIFVYVLSWVRLGWVRLVQLPFQKLVPYPWRYPSSIVRHMSCVITVSTITTDIKSILGANVHNVPGLYLLGIIGVPYISHKIMAQKPYLYTFLTSLKLLSDGASYYARRSPEPMP